MTSSCLTHLLSRLDRTLRLAGPSPLCKRLGEQVCIEDVTSKSIKGLVCTCLCLSCSALPHHVCPAAIPGRHCLPIADLVLEALRGFQYQLTPPYASDLLRVVAAMLGIGIASTARLVACLHTWLEGRRASGGCMCWRGFQYTAFTPDASTAPIAGCRCRAGRLDIFRPHGFFFPRCGYAHLIL